jgi:predicted permease
MGTFWQDIRYGVRTLGRNPGFTAVAVLTLALGLGAATGIYNLAQALLVRSAPGVQEPGRLVQIGRTRKGEGFGTLSYADFAEFRDQAKTVELAAMYDTPFHLGTGAAAERVRGAVVSGNYFTLLGVGAAAGRTFGPQEDAVPGAPPVAVVSFGLWQRYFGGDTHVVGRTVLLNGCPFTVVGVTAAQFKGTERLRELEVWVPLTMLAQAVPELGTRRDLFSDHGAVWHDAIGRLKPGVSLTQARMELETIAHRLEQAFPSSNDERGVAVEAGTSVYQRDRGQTREVVTLLLTVAGLVLLGACVNVTNMQLARGAVRRREMGIRLALGAGGRRLVRQLFTESLLLALVAGGVGMLLAVWLSRVMVLLAPAAMGLTSLQLGPDGRVFAFTAGLTLLTALVCGLAPSWRLGHGDLAGPLKDAPAQFSSSRSVLRSSLVVVQVAFSLLLLVGAGLFLRTLQYASNLRSGLPVHSVLVATIDLGLQGYDSPRGLAFFSALRERVLKLPGVQAASFAATRPFHEMNEETSARAQGSAEGDALPLCCTTVASGFFQTLALTLLEGRDFGAADTAGAPAVAIVDASTARRLWPGRSALGESVVLGGRFGAQSFEVIGVARDTPFGPASQPVARAIYLPHAQHYQPQMVLYVRTVGDPSSLLAGVRTTLASLEPGLPLFAVRTLAEELGRSLGPQRITASLVSVFAAFAVTLASVGLYGVVAWSVAQRTREIGVRMALGARPRDIARIVLRHAGRLVLGGLVLGLGLSFALTRLVKSQLVGVSPTDVAAFALGPLILMAVALLASYLPARRAARIDPMVALRSE